MLDKSAVEYISKLAKIEINQSEKEFLSSQLSKIIGYIDKLKQVNTEGVKPMRSLHNSGIMRQDKAKESKNKKGILDNAPSCQNNFFKIPRVIK